MTTANFHESFAAALDDPSPEARPDGLSGIAASRFTVYRNNMHRALGEALAAAYPAVQRLVGEKFFAATARAYHAQEETRSATLTRHGAGFADFLAAFPPVAHLPYLADVARLERAWLEALHAADRPSVDAARVMAQLDRAEQLTFAPHPATRLVASHYPAVTIWQANQP
ncbi:MAG: putative DNA-binding domain-containing protein [Alphaproteobacteria bacterium]|nr:putative DNA-binding domain-containing protein [Alphaproteobacteria bacterium]